MAVSRKIEYVHETFSRVEGVHVRHYHWTVGILVHKRKGSLDPRPILDELRPIMKRVILTELAAEKDDDPWETPDSRKNAAVYYGERLVEALSALLHNSFQMTKATLVLGKRPEP